MGLSDQRRYVVGVADQADTGAVIDGFSLPSSEGYHVPPLGDQSFCQSMAGE
jgi:hypothetical protein